MLIEGKDDSIQQYSLDLLWRGLNHMVRRDAVREGNGPVMLLFWKLDLLNFWCLHPRYLRIGHRLLASKYRIVICCLDEKETINYDTITRTYINLKMFYFTDAGGILTPAQSHQLVWNRVGNLSGRPGCNLALDLINEFKNNGFKSKIYFKFSCILK